MNMETPLLRVSRPVSACARCRNAKIKCDGKLPACSACERAGKVAECSSANDQFAKGKERSYVSSLESRIEKLEKQIVQCKSQGGPRHLRPSDECVGGGVAKRSERKEASDVDELVSDFGYLSVNATASGYHGFTQEMSFARLVISTACVEVMPQASMNALPPRDLATTLVEECMHRVFSLYPILSDTAIFGSLEAVYQHDGHYCAALDRWNVRMVLAIALLCRSQTKDDAQYQSAVRHASIALEQRESVIQPGSVTTVQAVLLLVIYSVLDPSHYSSWYLIGVASRIMVDIGLHQEPSEELRMKPSRLELRRRLFYCVYSLDRLISMTFTRALSFTDDSINVELPPTCPSPHLSHLNTFSAGLDSVNGSINLVKFRRSQSKYYQALFGANRAALYEPWQNRCSALHGLKSWFLSLSDAAPDFLKHILHSELFYICILLIQPPLGTALTDSYGISLLFDYSIGYAQSTWLVCHHSRTYNPSTSLDLIRAISVAQGLLHLLRDPIDLLFDVEEPLPPPVPPDLALPSLQKRTVAETAIKAIDAITQMDQVIDMLGRKFGYPQAYPAFKRDSAVTLQKLYTRRQNQHPFASDNAGNASSRMAMTEPSGTKALNLASSNPWHYRNSSSRHLPQ